MPLDFDALQQKKARSSASGWRPKDGRNEIRVLPHTKKYFTEAMGDFAHEYNVHFFNIEGERTRMGRCRRDEEKKCPACDAYWNHRKSDDPALQEAVAGERGIRAIERHMLNIVDVNNTEGGIQQYEANYTVYRELLKYISNSEWGDCLHPKEGRNFVVELTPRGKSPTGRNKYDAEPAPNPSDISELLPDGWEESLDQAEAAVPAIMDGKDMIDLLERMGVPVEGGEDFRKPASVKKAEKTPASKQAEKDAEPEEDTSSTDTDDDPEDEDSEQETVVKEGWPPGLEERDDGKPVCFSQYNPDEHPCDHPCPVRMECQMAKIGLG